jgi:hypothetical protein
MLEYSRLAERGNLKLKVIIEKTPYRFLKISLPALFPRTPGAMIVFGPVLFARTMSAFE